MSKVKDLKGKTFGSLTALEFVGVNRHKKALWRCKCVCGGESIVTSIHLCSGHTKSCGCEGKGFIDMVGEQHGRYTVLKYVGKNEANNSIWLCRCSCGTEKEVLGYSLRTHKTLSCGCLHSENLSKRNYVHGMSDTPEYKAFKSRKRLELSTLYDSEWTCEMDFLIHETFDSCVVCSSVDNIAVDHVRALSKGFGLKPGNAVILCRSCNSSKSNKDLSALPQGVQDKIISAAALFKEVWDNYVPEVYEEDVEDLSDWEGWQ